MIQFKGLEYKLGNQERTEIAFSLESLGYHIRRIQQEYPGGSWVPCLQRAHIGIVYNRDDEKLWMIRLEMDIPTQPIARLMAVHQNTVALLKDPGE